MLCTGTILVAMIPVNIKAMSKALSNSFNFSTVILAIAVVTGRKDPCVSVYVYLLILPQNYNVNPLLTLALSMRIKDLALFILCLFYLPMLSRYSF